MPRQVHDDDPATPLLGLAYASSPTQPMGTLALGQLLLQARAFNAGVQVTGVLLYSPQAFLQYIEGPPAGVAKVFERVSASSRHHSIQVLMREAVSTRVFADWQMGFSEAPSSLLQRLANQQWARAMEEADRRQPAAEALALLRAFWRERGQAAAPS